MRGSGRIIGTVVAGTALLAVSAPAGHAAGSAGSDERDFARPAVAQELTLKKGTKWAACTAKADTPHWSRGARSVIYKTRVTCKGNVSRVHVKVRGWLIYSSGGGPSTAATSNETRVIATNGRAATYYTPKVRGKKVRWSGKFQGSSTVQITSPVRGTKGTTTSKAQFVKAH
ncbi:hypothetical protein I5Q34_17610 [Streptomyces sp. AV19]|uniref:hypothetical protein n=1 Tax=Streptomyces sp. AV19 TaxID=2793068 RepID=UPI0018FEE1D7|nr:hypothetical protein [Streptomyces sp. AV19]MBH1936064.1 hypothetical protein [Streptomyces sp. AV19]MDG4534142.1 hypothetical protein [Streptomyces sp. AV19]